MKVEVAWGKKGNLFLATVRKINDDGTLNLLWDAPSKTKGVSLVTKACPVSKLKMEVLTESYEKALRYFSDY